MIESEIISSKQKIRDAIVHLGGGEIPFDSPILLLPFKCHSHPNRLYHDNSHREDIARPIDSKTQSRFGGISVIEKANAFKCLIGNYHDVVQLGIDKEVVPEILQIIDKYIMVSDGGAYYLKEDIYRYNKRIAVLLGVFGFEPGHELSLKARESNPGGLNECLSAMVAMEDLYDAGLPMKNIACIVFAIAATIPFRGQRVFDELVDRFCALQVGLNQEEIDLAIKIAVETANCDVNDFREGDFIDFIQGTWRLLPEYSRALRDDDFQIVDYRKALLSTLIFLRDKVNYKNIFISFNGYPSDIEIKDMQHKAEKNLDIGILYIQAKLAAIGLLEAVASLVAMNKSLKNIAANMKHIDYVLSRELDKVSKTVYETLVSRQDDIDFDSSESPIAEYLFAILDEEIVLKIGFMVEDLLSSLNHPPRYREFLSQVRDILGRERFDVIMDGLAEVADIKEDEDENRAGKIRAISLILDSVDN